MLNHKKYSAAQLEMLDRVVRFAFNPDYISITNSVPALAAALTSLAGIVTSVYAMLADYELVITGIAEQKRLTRISLANVTYSIVKPVQAYAKATNNSVLANEMKTSLSALKKIGYVSLINKINGWINIVSPLVPALSAYGVDAALFNQWLTKRDALKDLLGAPKAAIDEHTLLGTKIETTMKQAMTITKEQIDDLVAVLMQTQPSYYNRYRRTRRISSPATRHTKLRAEVTDELGQPVFDATITVNELKKDDRTFDAVSETTDLNGSAEISTFEPGIRTVTVQGPGIISKTFGPYQFHPGKVISQSFIIQPAISNLPKVEKKILTE